MKLITTYSPEHGHEVTGCAFQITLPHRILMVQKIPGEVTFQLLRYHHAKWHEIKKWDADVGMLEILDYVANVPEKMEKFQLP